MSATNKEVAAQLYIKILDKIKEIDDAMKTKDARIKRLEDALRFYAEGTPTQIGCDRGKRAALALGGE